MLITLPNADFSSAGLGKVTRLINGMPAADLIGLYLFDDGADGDTITTLVDKSGNGNNASVRTNWSGGKKRSYGLEVDNANGVCYQTPIAMNRPGRKFTIIVAGSNTLPGSELHVHNNWIGASLNNGMASPTQTLNNIPALTINYTGTDTTGRWQIYNGGKDLLGVTTLFINGNDNYNQPSIAAMTIDGVAGDVILSQLGETASPNSLTSLAAVQSFYDGVTDIGVIEFGPWAHVAKRSANTTIAHVYMVAIYDAKLSEAEIQERFGFMRAICEGRGITGF